MSTSKWKKPSCWLERKYIGNWLFEPLIEWIAYDAWGKEVARGHTRRDCEKGARENGYVPRRR